MTLYLAGPMAGIDEFNRPAFDKAAHTLRRAGYGVVNPHELDDEYGVFESPEDEASAYVPPQHRASYMRRDLPYLLNSHGIVMLDGWMDSRGASIELLTALVAGIRPYALIGDDVVEMPIGLGGLERAVDGMLTHLHELRVGQEALL